MSFACAIKDVIENGDTVIIYINHTKSVALTVQTGGQFNNQFGAFMHDDLIGKPFGTKWLSKGTGRYVYALHPTPELWTQVLSHRTQIIYTTDASFIIHALNIKPGSKVIESGTGSGSLSHHILRTIAPTGHLFTFEFHLERHLEAVKEFQEHDLSSYVTGFHADAYKDGFGLENSIDAVFLDLPNPWLAVPHAKKALRKNATTKICTFSPCIEQIQRTVAALTAADFKDIFMVEVLEKSFQSRKTASVYLTFPEPEMKCHTSFLLFASLVPEKIMPETS